MAYKDPAKAREYRARWMREHYNTTPHGRKTKRAWNLKSKYGMTLEEYDALLASQGGKCAICHNDILYISLHLNVDHNHKTNQRRGILCEKCNKGLGLFNDDRILLFNAITYLMQYTGNEVLVESWNEHRL